MSYNKTTEGKSWYNIETRNIRADELYDLYTAVGDNILTGTGEIGQIILFRHGGSVQANFVSHADQVDTNSVFGSRVEKVTEYPLKTWLQNNNPHSAYRITTKTSGMDWISTRFTSSELEFPIKDPDDGQTVLDRIISSLESKNGSSLISITIAPNFLQDNNKTKENQYFCRPVEIVATDDPVPASGEEKPVVRKFTALNTDNYSYKVKQCAVDDAIEAIAYGKIEYRGNKNIPLEESDLRSVLGQNKNNHE